MSNEIFRGIATALITPFNDKGVDYESYGRLIDWQIESGIDALVSCGTSGESPTLSVEEHKEIIRFAVERVAGRVPLVAGTRRHRPRRGRGPAGGVPPGGGGGGPLRGPSP